MFLRRWKRHERRRDVDVGDELQALHVAEHSATIPDHGPSENAPRGSLPRRELWQPQELRRRSLMAFLVSMIVIMLAIAILFAVSERNQGLCRIDNDLYYLWTYAPTAVFTLLLAYWSLAEYRIRQLLPWKLMSQGPTPAAQSVLLDYLSVWNGTALYRSLRKRHFFVSLAIGVTLLLQLITVLSTGLLAAHEITVSGSVPVTIHQRFNENFDGRILAPPIVSDDAAPTRGTGGLADGLAYSAAYGQHRFNLSYGLGANGHYVYPQFDSAAIGTRNTSLSISTDVLGFQVICEEGKPRTSASRPDPGYLPGWLLSVGTCNVPTYSAYTENNFTSVLSVNSLQHGYCNVNASGSPPKDHAKAAIVYTTSRLSMSPPGQPIWFIDDAGKNATRYSQIAGLVCRARYNINEATITYSGSTDSGDLLADVKIKELPARSLPRVTESDLLTAAWLSLSSMSITETSNLPPDLAAFEDVPIISRYLEQVFSATAAQIAQRWLLEPANDTRTGKYTSLEDRLVVHPLSFGLIEGMCAITVILTIYIYMRYIPCAVCPTDPSSIGCVATALGKDSNLCKFLDNTGTSDSAAVADAVKAASFHTQSNSRDPTGRFQIEYVDRPLVGQDISTSLNRRRTSDVDSSKDPAVSWWRPWSISIWAYCLTAGICFALFIALEISYRVSSRNEPKGIINVTPHDPYLRYSWTYLPATLTTSVQLLIASLYSTGELFQPYHALRQGGASARQSLMARYPGPLPLRSLWRAAILRQRSIIALASAAVLAPLLTIVVSGLLNPNFTQGSATTIQLMQSEVWNLTDTWYQAQRTFPQAVPATLVLYSNLSYPAFTYQDLAFPSFQAPVSSISKTASTIQATVPALRAVFNCTGIPSDQLRITHDYGIDKVHAPSVGGKHCPSLAGGEFQITAPKDYSFVSSMNGTFIKEVQASNPGAHEGCPSFKEVFTFMEDAKSPANKANMIYCTPYIESVDVRTTFVLPNFTIDVTKAPQPLNDTAKVVLRGFFGPHSKSYARIIYPWELSTVISGFNTQNDNTDGWSEFMKAAVYGVNGVPLAELVSYNDTVALIARFEQVFGIMMAQLLHTSGRSTTPSATTIPDHLPTFDAIAVGPSSLRLIQSVVSTRILQVLLASMAACIVLAHFAIKSRRILPKNPSSIAAVASLLAGSELLSLIPPGSEWGSEKDHLKLFDGWLFSMGWWNNGGKRRFGIDIGQHADNAKADRLGDLAEKHGNAQVVVRERSGNDDRYSHAHTESI